MISPFSNFGNSVVHEYLSAEYKIWNCNGDVLSSSVPKALLKQMADM